jgi:hypothetical protein
MTGLLPRGILRIRITIAVLAIAGLLSGQAFWSVARASAAPSACAGTSYTWTGDGNGATWTDPLNWSPNGDPGTCSADSVTIDNEANITAVPAVHLADLTVTADAGSDGTLLGGPISVSGNFEWDGSTFDSTINMLSGSTGEVAGPGNFKGLGGGGLGQPGRLNIAGSLTLDNLSGSTGSLGLSAGIGQGTIDVQRTGLLTSTGQDNIGGASCCAGSDNPTLVNDGKIDIASGRLMTQGLEATQAGSLTVGAHALFDVDSPVQLGDKSSYSGTGRMLLDLGAFPSSIDGMISIGKGFTFDLGPQACLEGTGTVSGRGTFDFSGGYLPAKLTVAKGALMEVTGPGVKNMSTFACGTAAGDLIDSGRLLVDEGTLNLGGTGSLSTERGGVLSIAPGAMVGTGEQISNAGTLEVGARPSDVKRGTPAGVSQVSLTNTGNIVANRGQTLLLDGVPVTNRGTVTADSGLITVTETYTQQRTGTLAITIARGSAGNGLGQLAVDATASLAGVLRLSLGRGFSPRHGQQFEVVRYLSRKGKFGRLSGSPRYRISYHAMSASAIYG